MTLVCGWSDSNKAEWQRGAFAQKKGLCILMLGSSEGVPSSLIFSARSSGSKTLVEPSTSWSACWALLGWLP